MHVKNKKLNLNETGQNYAVKFSDPWSLRVILEHKLHVAVASPPSVRVCQIMHATRSGIPPDHQIELRILTSNFANYLLVQSEFWYIISLPLLKYIWGKHCYI
jgi:hypothetical protein